jgi:hypothetical protein
MATDSAFQTGRDFLNNGTGSKVKITISVGPVMRIAQVHFMGKEFEA